MLHFYNTILVPLEAASYEEKKANRDEIKTPVGVSEARILHDDHHTKVELGDVKIRFHRWGSLSSKHNDLIQYRALHAGHFELLVRNYVALLYLFH